ncbi:MAG: 4-alpha-glucanotransferase [Magnetococcales bacterium]|nr:4-alpha-glucanotransferase [Magnetococcales bacterium]
MTVTQADPADALTQLAVRCGIIPEYQDFWGNPRKASEKTLRLLLQAMHLPWDGDPQATLQYLNNQKWLRPLPPVLVVQVGEVPSVPYSLPLVLAKRGHRWIVTHEGIKVVSGDFKPVDLPDREETRLGKSDYLRSTLTLAPLTTPGYYRLEVEQPTRDTQTQASMALIVTPRSFYLPTAIQEENRYWGPSVQWNGMRSRRNWGIGDFGDLRNLVDLTAQSGGNVVAVSPLHAPLLDETGRCNPYTPSHRCFLNYLYLDIEALPEFAECEEAQTLVASEHFQGRLRRLRTRNEINTNEIASVKLEVLTILHRHFRDHHKTDESEQMRVFRLFCKEQGAVLEQHARFEALHEHFLKENPAITEWTSWPRDYRVPDDPAVVAFAEQHSERVEFFSWIQWRADRQLASAGQQFWQHSLPPTLCQDLAVGVDSHGSEAWLWQNFLAAGAQMGAPPDRSHPGGLNWGVLPFVPHRLRDGAYAPFITLLRANMRHCAMLRLDQVSTFLRSFWVPDSLTPEQGAFVTFPLADMLGIVALESHRQRCLIIGKGDTSVPEPFLSEKTGDFLASAGLFPFRPFLTEHATEGWLPSPNTYPRQTVTAIGDHDTPTLRGFWLGSDIDARARLQLFSSEEQYSQMVVERAQDRARCLMALEREGLLPKDSSIHPVSVPDITLPFMVAFYTYLARSEAQILLVQPENIFGVMEQNHLPGSSNDQYPNWRQRLPLDLEDWRYHEHCIALRKMLCIERSNTTRHRELQPKTVRKAVIPRATYRLQFNKEFTFQQATALLPYLAELGISHCYASPYLKARPGSNHGYDIVDHTVLNPEIGTPEDYEEFIATMKKLGLGQILDVVPNHMGIMGADTIWWQDVLENGRASAWGTFFDIDWEPINADLRDKVLIPLLGDHYGAVLNRGELTLHYDSDRGEFCLYYYQHRLPIDPATYPCIIGHRIERLASIMGQDNKSYSKLQTLLTAFGHLPARTATNPALVTERQRDKEEHKNHLAALSQASTDISHHIADVVEEYNGRAGDSASFDMLHDLIQLQGYRLAYWRVAADEINYRRFFDINHLAALRMEEPKVFDATHCFLLDLLSQGKVDGFRIDHPDGLLDPGRYLNRLQQLAGGEFPVPGEPLPLYLVIEKILADHERLPDEWPIHGATGYRFANLVNNLFVNTGAEKQMTHLYRMFPFL